MTPARRSTDVGFAVRCFRFVSAPLVDGNTGRLSITRLLAAFDTLLAAHIVEEHHPLSGTVLALLVMAMAAAFGKSTFGFFLTRYELKQSLADTVNLTHANTNTNTNTTTTTDTTTRDIKEIVDRRNALAGVEATP